MRRTALLLASMTLVLIVAGGVALAASFISCPGGGLDCSGTNADDRIKGTDSDEKIYGLGGSDTIDGNGGQDVLIGDDNFTTDRSMDGDDKLDGGPGDHGLHGYGGSDTFVGGSGADIIDAGDLESTNVPGTHNTVRAGSGDDDVFSVNGVPDSIDCGTGSEIRGDSAVVDGLDKVAKNCEDPTIVTPQ
jgi:Ca2+-binding RTX toxin-like protein